MFTSSIRRIKLQDYIPSEHEDSHLVFKKASMKQASEFSAVFSGKEEGDSLSDENIKFLEDQLKSLFFSGKATKYVLDEDGNVDFSKDPELSTVTKEELPEILTADIFQYVVQDVFVGDQGSKSEVKKK